MRFPIPAAVTVKDGPYSATANVEAVGANLHAWAREPVAIHLVACHAEGDTLTALNGIRSDTERPSPATAVPTREEAAALLADPSWARPMELSRELAEWILDGRPEDARPSWLPADA